LLSDSSSLFSFSLLFDSDISGLIGSLLSKLGFEIIEETVNNGVSCCGLDEETLFSVFWGSVFEDFSVEENEFRLRKKEEEYRFLFSLGNYGTEFEIKECSHNYAKAELQPDGSLYILVRLMGESFGALHILIRKKEKHTLLFLRKVEEYALPEFNGFFDAERIK